MTPSLLALLAYAGWTLALLVGIVSLRSAYVLGGRAANDFSPDGADVSPFSHRLSRAHANCYENLPIFAAVIAAAALSDSAAVTDPLAWAVVCARVGQSCVHLASTSAPAVILRFGLLLPQLGVIGWWLYQLVSAA